jgi:hypothetical protein
MLNATDVACYKPWGFLEISIHTFTGAYRPGWTFGLPFRGFYDHTHN